MDKLRRLTPAAWIAVVGLVAGVAAFGWFVSWIPFSTMGTGEAVGAASGVVMVAAMFFVPQALIVVLFAIANRSARIVGATFGGVAALGGIVILAMWAGGAQFEGAQSYDPKALGLWLPLIVMGIIDGIAAVVALLALRGEGTPNVPHASAA